MNRFHKPENRQRWDSEARQSEWTKRTESVNLKGVGVLDMLTLTTGAHKVDRREFKRLGFTTARLGSRSFTQFNLNGDWAEDLERVAKQLLVLAAEAKKRPELLAHFGSEQSRESGAVDPGEAV